MSLSIKPHHPLQELLAKLLFSIETVPAKEQRRMVNRACREAVKWHRTQVEKMQLWIKDMEKQIQTEGGNCPECGEWLDGQTHKRGCDLAIMLANLRENS